MAVNIAIGASITLVIALLWSAIRTYRIDDTLRQVMIETAKATSLVFIILLGAAMLTAAFRAFGGEELVRHFLEGIPGGFWAKFITVMVVIFILGFFLDFIEIAVVVVPIVAPILLSDPSANITAVWLGVMIGLNIQTSFLTPPFGFALFYLRGVAPAIVKTIDMYKGVIPFIALQLIALAIVAYFPPLVNYLPNRVSFLSETAPPPRNPKLQLCLEDFTAEQFATGEIPLSDILDRAKALDYSALPEDLQEDFIESFDTASEAMAKLDESTAAAAVVAQNTPAYRPAHREVRDIQAAARDIEERIADLKTTASRIRGDNKEERRKPFEASIEELQLTLESTLGQVPESWDAVNSDFTALTKAEDTARLQYRRAADQSYDAVGEVGNALAASEEIAKVRKTLQEVLPSIDGIDDTADLVSQLTLLNEKVNTLPRIGGVRSNINTAIDALDRSEPPAEDETPEPPDTAAAVTAIEEGLASLNEELSWQEALDGSTKETILELEEAMRLSLGIRSQSRMTRDQALYVAMCNAEHRDVSLKF